MRNSEKIRNIAIIAHIDHGKTTLIDGMLKQSNIFGKHEAVPERVLDSYELEKERGITIFAKHTSIPYEDYKINLIDTPGHADFSGEVERVLGMVSCVLLLVDAKEGPMPQTRFVLSQALKLGLSPIVVLNKIDRPHANPDEALNRTFDLFVELGANDEQLDFSYCYASALEGFAMQSLDDPRVNLRPLFEMIVEKVPAPTGNAELPFLMQASTMSYDDYLGRGATGRILEGTIKKGEEVTRVDEAGHPTKHHITKIEGYRGVQKIELDLAEVGDIITLYGIPDIMIGDTLCSPSQITQLPPIMLSDPTLSVEIMVNSSPFVGRDGKHVTMSKIKDRLLKEKKANISLKIEEVSGKEEVISVAGKGELHLSVLLEAMRREGYEFSVSKPKVILKETNGILQEPYESVHVEVPEEFSGSVIDQLNRRKGELRGLSTDEHAITTLEYLIPTRGLMGFRNDFLSITKGKGVLTSVFDSYGPWKGDIAERTRGALISLSTGRVTGYAAFNIQNRGTLFVKPGDDVYEGMVVGENSRENDLVVNLTKEKQLTNIRSAGTDENVILTPPRILNLEQAIDFIDKEELIEITPHFIRLRKRLLKESERKRK